MFQTIVPIIYIAISVPTDMDKASTTYTLLLNSTTNVGCAKEFDQFYHCCAKKISKLLVALIMLVQLLLFGVFYLIKLHLVLCLAHCV